MVSPVAILAVLELGLPAHVGGIPTLVKFQEPTGTGNVGQDTYQVVWTDNELDLTGRVSFLYQPTNLPPGGTLDDLTGVAIPEGSDIPYTDATNNFVWDVSGVPDGSYFLYGYVVDPGFAPLWKMTEGTVTVQHAGSALFPAVVIQEPDGSADVVANAYPVQFTASGTGPLTATLWGMRPKSAEPPQLLVADYPLATSDGTHFTGCYLWNLSALASGYHFVKIEVKDGAGRTHTAFSPGNLVIYRNPNPVDAGPAPSCSAPGADADGGLDGGGGAGDDDPGAPTTCGCRVGGARDVAAGGLAGLVGLAGGLVALTALSGGGAAARRRRRRNRTRAR